MAWRVHDAQYWGVPQRRRRISLVADFGGDAASEILFEQQGVSGDPAEDFRSWQRAAGSAADCVGASGFDGYNGELTGDVSSTLGVNCGMSTGRNGIVLNDQGGNRMDVTDEVTATLRAEAHHPPVVMEAAGFCTEHFSKSRSIGYEEEMSPTLRAGVVPAAVALENHPTDSRVKISEDGKVQTLTSRMGTGGNNVPLVMKIRSGCEGGGKGPLIQENKSATLSCNNDQTLFEPCGWDGRQVSPTLTKQNAGDNQRMPDKNHFNCVLQPFGISSHDSNAMKSDNPHSGIYEAETARTLDGNGGNPGCNQGGIAVVESYAIQGSMIGRDDKNDPQGDGINEDVSFTLNTVDRHAVYAMTTGSFTQVAEDKAPTVFVRDYKDPTAVCYGIGRDTFNQGKNAKFSPPFVEELQPTLVAKEPGAIQNGYTVRRLTPTECARLQGFPDWWVDIGDWTDSKGKKHKAADSPRYKALGNSIALPFWQWMFGRMAKYLPENATLGSLFDGIGGFPLTWQRIHGEGSARWSSEIEEFPMAVTRLRFGTE